jgi:acyl-CoA synthetase (NDP forming)
VSDLRPFFAPKSVAVVGAGERATSSGGAVLKNLAASRFAGRIVPVNPKGGVIQGNAAKTSLRDLGEPADLAVIVVPPPAIPEVVRDAAASGHTHLLILPGGFAEAGEEGRRRDAEVRGFAASNGLTIAGPNCAGIIGPGFAATFLRDLPKGGGAALISQSGALSEEAICASHLRHIPLGTVVSVGNAMQLGVADYLAHLGEDPAVTSVLLYVESIDDPRRFRAIARQVAAKKPVVGLFGGRTLEGGRAAAAHTGAIANTDRAISAFAEDCGIIRVESMRRLMLAAKGFGRFPQGFGPRVLLLSNSGGPGVLATDRAAVEGLDLVDLPQRLKSVLRQRLPAEASVANPLDLLADAREERFSDTLSSALADADAFDAILMIHVVPFMVDAGPVIAALAPLCRDSRLPILHSMMGTLEHRADWFRTMEDAGVPMFEDAEAMAECAGLLARYQAARARALAGSDAPPALKGR